MNTRAPVYDIIILIQSMSGLGGTEIVALNLLKALREYGENIIILSLEPYDGDEDFVRCVWDENRSGVNNNCSFLNRLQLLKKKKNLRKLVYDFCKNHDVRTIINFTYENLSILPFGQNIKTIGVYHWSVVGYEQSLFKIANGKAVIAKYISRAILRWRFYRLHKLIGKTDYSVALTNSGANELRKLANHDNVIVIPNFLPYDLPSDVEFHRSSKHRAIYVGRLSVEKGVFHLLDVWEKVAAKLEDVTLSIYGTGDERTAMEQIIAERGIPRIEFKGFEQNAGRIYDSADLLLCTSVTEGFGMVLVEAMHFGVTPIAFDCPVSPKELIADAGLTVGCFDVDLYAREVIKLFKNPELRLLLREHGIRRAKNFLKSNVIDQWIRLLRKNIL